MASIEHLAAQLAPLLDAISPPDDALVIRRARSVLTEDGRVRMDRATGKLSPDVVLVIDAASVHSDPNSVGVTGNLQDQLQDVSEAVVGNSVAAADTFSVNMNAAPVGGVIEISAAVNYDGSGSSELAARSDHSHAGTYAPVPLAGSTTVDLASIAAGAIASFTISVAGAGVGDCVLIGAPGTLDAGLMFSARVGAADTVFVRVHNTTAAAIDPAAATWKAQVYL